MVQCLFPNPAASMVTEDYLFHFEFLGRVLAKAVFEDILVEPQFSPVFLNKLLGRVSGIFAPRSTSVCCGAVVD